MAGAQALPKGATRAALALYGVVLLAYVANILQVTAAGGACCLTEDSASYLGYWDSELFQFRRTPAYPLFIATIEALFGPGLRPLLLAQAALQALVPAIVLLLVRQAWPDRSGLAVVAGLACAASFVAIGLSHHVLSEPLFAFLSMGALAALYFGAHRGNRALLWVSTLAAGLAILTRPNFVVFVALFPVLFMLFGSGRAVLRQAALPLLVLALVPITLGAVNQVRFGVFTLSSISAEAAAVYWGSRTLAAARNPDPQVYRFNSARDRDAIWEQALRIDDLGARDAFYSATLRDIVSAHPGPALSAFVTSLGENAPRPFDQQYLAPQLERFALPALAWLRQFLPVGLNEIFYLGVTLGIWRMLAERQLRLAAGLLAYVGALWLTTGISYWQGARLMYPAEPVLAIFFACGSTWVAGSLARAWASRRGRASPSRAT